MTDPWADNEELKRALVDYKRRNGRSFTDDYFPVDPAGLAEAFEIGKRLANRSAPPTSPQDATDDIKTAYTLDDYFEWLQRRWEAR